MERQSLIGVLANTVQQKRCSHPLRVAIDGVDAAGKTMLANELATCLRSFQQQVIQASVDDFHHPEKIRRRKGSLSPEGFYHDSYNYPALIENLLIPLGPNGNRQYRTASFDLHQNRPVNTPVKTASENAILLLDGIFLLRPVLLAYWDLTIYIDADFTTTMQRGIARDEEIFGSTQKAAQRYRERYMPGQQLYHQESNPLDRADIVIDNNQIDTPKILRNHTEQWDKPQNRHNKGKNKNG